MILSEVGLTVTVSVVLALSDDRVAEPDRVVLLPCSVDCFVNRDTFFSLFIERTFRWDPPHLRTNHR